MQKEKRMTREHIPPGIGSKNQKQKQHLGKNQEHRTEQVEDSWLLTYAPRVTGVSKRVLPNRTQWFKFVHYLHF